MTRRVRRPALLQARISSAALLIVAGCLPYPPTPETTAACIVCLESQEDQIVLLSEALASDAAREPFESAFSIAPCGTGPVDLQLSAVGCHCYEVLHAGRALRVGDRVSIPSGGRSEVRIASRSVTSPGIRKFQADFTTRGRDGSQSTLTLAGTVRTIADLAVQPDVVSVDPGAGANVSAPIGLLIEQHVRTPDVSAVHTQWGALPPSIACNPPELTDSPTQIAPGLWRLRWRSLLAVSPASANVPAPDAPQQLELVSLNAGRQLARAACTLIPRRRSGVRAPPLVHFGRIEPDARATRRIQLAALDGQRFSVTAAFTRDGEASVTVPHHEPAVEHWLEVAVATPGAAVDDLLTIQTDHPTTGQLQIPVRSIGPFTGR